MNMRWKAGIGIVLLALAACGEKKADSGGSKAAAEDSTAAELARFQAEENARSQVTLIDAAMADAAAMPAEWNGPIEPEAETAEGNKQATDHKSPKERAAAEPAIIPQEEFPSVAD